MAYLTIQRFRGRPVAARLRQIEQHERLDAEAYRKLCQRNLRQMLIHAHARVPLYATGPWADALHPSCADQIEHWPVLERATVEEHGPALLAVPHLRNLWYRRSSASTSKRPLRVAWDPPAAAWSWANQYRAMAWHGVPIGARTLMLWGVHEPAVDWILNRKFFPTKSLTVATLDAAARWLIAKRPTLIWGFPSAVAQLARYVGYYYPHAPRPLARLVKIGGEQVYPFQRREIETYLGARVLQLYGCSELGAIAGECPAGALHVYGPHVHIETFRNGKPVPPGEFGDLVITSTINRAMPLIRYRVGDQGRIIHKRCPCGLPHPILADLQGRCADRVYASDGTPLHGTVIGKALEAYVGRPPLGSARLVKFVQTNPTTWTVEVETDDDRTTPLEAQIRELISTHFGPGCHVHVKCVKLIPREPSGKFRYYQAISQTNSSA